MCVVCRYPTFKRKLEHRRDKQLFPEMTPLDVAHVLMTRADIEICGGMDGWVGK